MSPWVGGIEMQSISVGGGLNQALAANSYWVRYNALLWSDIEPTEGTRNWSAIGALDDQLKTAAAHGMQVVLVVRSTPAWAQLWSGVLCGPPKSSKIGAFAAFMRDAVARYSKPPYNVKYWMISNEPDVDYRIIPPASPFGCWGDSNDPYYFGGYYGEVIKQVYPAIKSANPFVQLILAGLLLDCDPRHPPPGKDCTSSKYLEGILRAGGGPYFDGVAVHAYDGYSWALGHYGDSEWNSDMYSTGPLLKAKTLFVREVMAKFNVTGKYVIQSEGALLCWNCNTTFDDYEQSKAYFMVHMLTTALALDVKAAIWYGMAPNWMQIDLVRGGNISTPAMTAMTVANSKLNGATYVGEIDAQADTGKPWGVRGYKFSKNGTTIWVLWSIAENSHKITLPSKPTAVFDLYNTPSAADQSFTLTMKPIYIEWR